MAEKKKILISGVEIKELIGIEEISTEKAIIEVPEYMKTRNITSGTVKIPLLNTRFKIQRDTDTIKFFKDWYFNNEVKDVIVIRTDGHGVEFGRTIYTACECAKYTETAYDGANPTYAHIVSILAPYDMIVQES